MKHVIRIKTHKAITHQLVSTSVSSKPIPQDLLKGSSALK